MPGGSIIGGGRVGLGFASVPFHRCRFAGHGNYMQLTWVLEHTHDEGPLLGHSSFDPQSKPG